MSPDAHWYIHRAEQAARMRAQPPHAGYIPRPRQRWAAKVWSMFGSHRGHARGRPHPLPGRGVLWRRT